MHLNKGRPFITRRGANKVASTSPSALALLSSFVVAVAARTILVGPSGETKAVEVLAVFELEYLAGPCCGTHTHTLLFYSDRQRIAGEKVLGEHHLNTTRWKS